MTNVQNILPIRLLFVLIFVGVGLVDNATAEASPVGIIVHADNPISEISKTSLRNIFTGKVKTWSGRERVFVILPAPGSEEMKTLLDTVLGLGSEDDLSRMYLKLIFQQKLQKVPLTAQTVEAAVTNVSAIEGAVALVKKADVPTDASVKWIEIEL